MKSLISNQQLFAEAYLRSLDIGLQHEGEAVHACWQTIKEWREVHTDLTHTASLLQYLGQCLSALGLSYTSESDRFVLYADHTTASPLGLCLLVVDDDLGRTTKGRHYQANLVHALRQQSLTWGVITNGRHWRLCNAASAAPYELYLQADLDEMLGGRDLVDFLLFYRFFGRGAFATDASHPNGKPVTGLDVCLAESENERERVQRYLQGQVEPVLGSLCLGFVQDKGTNTGGRDSLDEVYRNAIYLLYRILFLLYAEARTLLPLDSPKYQAVSLASILEGARVRQQEGYTDPDEWSLWRSLTRLFVIVDDGDEALGVRPYNGGLFSDTEKPYLKAHKISNAYLAPALYNLGFQPQGKTGAQPIDYRDLTVRHLGTLYEGLLEFKLNLVAGEPVVMREKDGKRQYIPQSQAGTVKRTETILDVGQIYFADDKGERKSSGSYYTPEDVVQYIVSNTLTPKLDERLAGLKQILAEARQERSVAATVEERLRIEQYADQRTLDAVEQTVLGLKVLDPAMGSAHFLVAAGQIITNILIETLNSTEWPNKDLDCDPVLWKRRVVERCLFGVDVNPLAQELAKLALWLSSASTGKPLTFLNHHLKVGNSLYGTPLAQIGMLPQLGKVKTSITSNTEAKTDDLFDFVLSETILSLLRELKSISGSDSDQIDDVKFKEQTYAVMVASSRRLQDVANVWLATLFGLLDEEGNPLTDQGYDGLRQACLVNYAPEAWESYVNGDWRLRDARRIADENHFFHWELEFPEAVHEGRCVFDVIIANPPYVGTAPNSAISSLYQAASCGDLYGWLLERSLSLVGDDCCLGMILPLSLMFARGFSSLRGLLLTAGLNMRYSAHDNIPDGLFNTPSVSVDVQGRVDRNMQRTVIILAQKSGKGTSIKTTDLLRWWCEDRSRLFSSLRFADTTKLCSVAQFPRIGNGDLLQFWRRLGSSDQRLRDIAIDIASESRQFDDSSLVLTVPRASGYFISATPGKMARNKVLSLRFNSREQLDLARVLINSNVFYWYWRSFGDGFLLGVDVVGAFPTVQTCDNGYLTLASKLDAALVECTTFKMYRGEKIPSYNFNRRMDILLEIDDWIVRQVAPDLDLPRSIFAQYKSNSFLRPLDLSMLMAVEDGTDNE